MERIGSGKLISRRPFEIDSSSGRITTLEVLDADEVSSYSLTVVAVDVTSTVQNPLVTSTQVN